MARIKVGDYVTPPEKFRDRGMLVKNGQKYKVLHTFELGKSFIIEVNGQETFCLSEGCLHVRGLDWVVIPNKTSLMKRIINFLTFKK